MTRQVFCALLTAYANSSVARAENCDGKQIKTILSNLPVNQYATACFDGALDKAIALREMLEQILILDIIHFDSHVCETIE